MRLSSVSLIMVLMCLGFTENVSAKGPGKTFVTYSAPVGAELNHDFTVQVWQDEGAWKESPCYLVLVDKVMNCNHHTEKSSISSFDFCRDVEVSVTYNKGTIDSARIRPLSYGIKYRIDKNTIYFRLDKPSNLSIEVNGDIFHNLQLFANPVEENIPKKKDKNVMYSDRVFILAKERVFCRNSDDCTTVYATRKGFTGGADDIIMQNSTLWADVAHPIFIGLHGNPEKPDTIQNLAYRN